MIYSGLQRKVFSLYREMLRIGMMKDRLGSANSTHVSMISCLKNPFSMSFSIRRKFRDDTKLYEKSEIDRIEHAIRQGKKWLKVVKMKGVSGFTFVDRSITHNTEGLTPFRKSNHGSLGETSKGNTL
jgi:hypothetical protein